PRSPYNGRSGSNWGREAAGGFPEEVPMTRLVALGLTLALVCHFPVHSQSKAPPKHFTNSIGMKFVLIPAGQFIMGSPEGEKGRKADETQHKVTLTKGFYMAVCPVTREQWKAVMGSLPPPQKGKKNLPVETVSWEDCEKFIKKLREKDKRPYRLPTDAECEHACRAGTTTPYAFGKTVPPRQANFGKFKKGTSPLGTTPVGSYPANAWGLHDLHGNVWEWCQDWYGDYLKKDVADPK